MKLTIVLITKLQLIIYITKKQQYTKLKIREKKMSSKIVTFKKDTQFQLLYIYIPNTIKK